MPVLDASPATASVTSMWLCVMSWLGPWQTRFLGSSSSPPPTLEAAAACIAKDRLRALDKAGLCTASDGLHPTPPPPPGTLSRCWLMPSRPLGAAWGFSCAGSKEVAWGGICLPAWALRSAAASRAVAHGLGWVRSASSLLSPPSWACWAGLLGMGPASPSCSCTATPEPPGAWDSAALPGLA